VIEKMEQLYAVEYLEEELKRTEQKLENDKNTFDKLKKEVKETEKKIRVIREKIDDTYETFSPIPVKYEVVKNELEILQMQLLELQTKKDTRECEMKESEIRVGKH
jgi:septal ring factor EnvC (AmiA/AmiB activator)